MGTTGILHHSSGGSVSGSGSGSDNMSWSSDTTWAIASGSLQNSVTVDSSYDSPDVSDSPRKFPPLILNPPASDSGPCEIKLSFEQKYSIRQIYVRSTARVYEVYYAQSQSSGSEYLCTARCSIAERDEKVLQAVNLAELSEENGKHAAVEIAGQENNAPLEDDWVEVKPRDSPILENGVGSLSNKTNSNTGGLIQDYYEATVEISDSDPCVSLSIRLLSLQNKGVVYIDEVYVFAELVGSIDSENQAPTVNGSAASPLMAMFVPTLLQLSKSCVSSIQGEQASDKLGKHNKVEKLSKSTDVNDIPADTRQGEKLTADQHYMKSQDVDGSGVESDKSQFLNHNVNGDRSHEYHVKSDSSYGHIEKVLEQLVSRVSKIEEVCLRFEENMLKPINSMEMRIQRVEQQLESLSKNQQYSGLPRGTRISAPSFSCESNSSSFHNDGSDCQPCRGLELERSELTSGALANPSVGMLDSVNAPCYLPSLVVTAPEFSCDDEEQDGDELESLHENHKDDEVSKPLNESSQERKKINDILAAALSRFLYSSSDYPSKCEQTSTVASDANTISTKVPLEHLQIFPSKAHEGTTNIKADGEPPKYTQILTVTAPEFTSEENVGEVDSDFVQFPFTGASHFFSKKKSDDNNEIHACGAKNGISAVASDSSDSTGYKSACDPLPISMTVVPRVPANRHSVLPEDTHPGTAHIQDQSFQESTTCSSLSSTADEVKGSAKTDVRETTKETGQGQPNMLLSPKKKNAQTLGADVQNHFSEESTTCIFLERSMSVNADQAKGSATANVSQTTEKTGQRESGNDLLPENSDVLEQCIGHDTERDSNRGRTVAGSTRCIAAEGPEKDILQNISKSATAALVDFKLPILDVKFASHEKSSSQTPLEALLSDQPDFNFEASSLGKGGGELGAAKETNLAEMDDDDETIDPVTSKRLLVDLGIYDIVVSSDEESAVDDYCTTYMHEMVTSLI